MVFTTDDAIVVEVGRRGKLLSGEPYFAPGVPIVLDPKGAAGSLRKGDLAVVRAGKGRARVERVLGPANRIENVLEALLVEHGASQRFEPYDEPEPSLEGRVDLRELTTITIDPETAKDFDDALSFRREPDGIRAWVHIADVSFFVPAGSPLDLGAAERALSTYVPGLVAPMLPHELSDDACSLRPHVDRLCVTVEMPPHGEPTFYRSVINSNARLTYGQAERRDAEPAIVEQLDLNAEVATALRAARFARGALEITSPEIAFSFADGRVERAWRESEPHAHMLVEELMIRANEHVAEFLSSRGRQALYRVHERPDPQSILRLLSQLADLEIPTPPVPKQLSPQEAADLAGAISRRVTEYVAQSGRGREAFPTLILRSLKQARYDPSNLGHSGLASVAYCHFTSPIRRYPDLVVHRALLRELGDRDEVVPSDLSTLAEETSAREREAGKLEYLADDICLAWLLEDTLLERGWEEPWEGEIIGMIGSGLFIRFGEVFEGMLPARKLPGEFFELSDTGTALVGRRSGKRYRLGDLIDVRVESIARHEGKVDLAPAGQGSRPPRKPQDRKPPSKQKKKGGGRRGRGRR
ncbi:MAG TPA: RNB domain-containing ribonuclease [Gaiellaceae bacterium]|jgi:ribonuclease R|nr:RNB domain-containing ribonuclease [Gaiellaceae bacterium]